MLKSKRIVINKKLSSLYDDMITSTYRIKAKDLKKILGLSITEIDEIIEIVAYLY